MLKKLKRRFMLTAMLAFGMVMFALIAGINIVNYLQAVRSQDRMLEQIIDYERMSPEQSGDQKPPIYEMPWAGGPEKEFTPRFFVVRGDEEGNLDGFGNEYIFSVNESEAEEYTKDILMADKASGYYKDYRYRVVQEERELTIAFLNVSQEVNSGRRLLVISLLIGMISMLIVFFLLLLLSRPAMRPYLKNMEMQKRFITDAGHELKTPITSIVTSADIAAMEFGENEWIQNIQRQASRLKKLVNGLVMLSRLDEEVPFPEKTEFSFSEAVWETAEPLAPMAGAAGKGYR